MRLRNVSRKLLLSVVFLAITALSHAQVGIQTHHPTEMLDVAEKGVRIRDINTTNYQGDVKTNKIVVADGEGVLKTVSYPNPKLLAGGGNAIAIGSGTYARAKGKYGSGESQEVVVARKTFTIDEPSLVQISYGLSMTDIRNYWGSQLYDDSENAVKLMGSGIIFESVPTGFTGVTPNYYVYSTAIPYTSLYGNGIGITFGYFYTNGSPFFKLAPGTYKIKIMGFVYSPPSDDNGISVKFSGSPGGASERLDIVAFPYPSE